MPNRRASLRALLPDERDRRREAVMVGPELDWSKLPAGLDRLGRAEWRRLAVLFRAWPYRVLEIDRAAVSSFCHWWSIYRRAQQDVDERGPLVPGRSSADAARGEGALVKNPALQVLREASTQLRYWARELGLTPDARGRMGLQHEQPADDDEDDPFD